ncbi:UvrD-helicase domain-containing protein [Gracilibacillus sp. S3-1-1]|uniref:UvrD-helicase domain-containing protein n=1 Tax=Gracilibacillus pellucidus TaxID=3095368 RepID=A0ACC6M1L7_9BACI|nr:UvrD-helicase domain-containing protein [Gracilibacillus sp. S3-1-1]MDX8044622.1 UvrD-helicase domain-containing protein [Gracilibacillus sp. S3-1-1]
MTDFSTLTPYELGETNQQEAIPFLLAYLEKGEDNEKRLAASAIAKLAKQLSDECKEALPFLLQNLSSEQSQVRQYTLKAIHTLALKKGDVTKEDVALIEKIKETDPKEYNQSSARKIIEQWSSMIERGESTVTNQPASQNSPSSTTKKEIEEAELANTQTTVELVSDEQVDAPYFRALEAKGIKLNEPQLHAVRHFNGSSLVLAGAGSGKTRVLSTRAGYLISVHKVNPKQILLLTFTKKAAEEMKERIADLPGLSQSLVRGITSGTYHSIFLRILRSQGDNRRILSSERQKHTSLKIIMKELQMDDYEPESLLEVLSHYKNNMTQVHQIPVKSSVDKEVKKILQKYEQMKQTNGYMDFDDILLDAYFFLRQNPNYLRLLQQRFAYVLCDEWQDTNPIQYELVQMIAKLQDNLFVVGDDDQTIYEFNGADSSIILNFTKDYPKAKTFHLNINYRSTTSIVGLANKVIAFNEKRYQKKLKATKEREDEPSFLRLDSSDQEAEMIIEKMLHDVKQGKRSFRDFAILYRTNSYNRAIFDQLVLKDIPFVIYGDSNSFYEQSVVKPVIDHLRLAMDGQDIEAVKGVLPSLYLNREKLTAFIQDRERFDPKETLLMHAIDYPNLKEFQKNQILHRIKLIQNLKDMKPIKAVQAIRKVYDKYLDALQEKNVTVHKEMLKETLFEIESAAKRFDTIHNFLAFVTEIITKNQQMEEMRKDLKVDAVKLMTIHKSKGLEFPVVYLVGASEDILPHSSVENGQEIEGERRLAYVAITRAEEELYVSSPAQYRGGKVGASRFMKEAFSIPEEQTSEKSRATKRVSINKNPSKKSAATVPKQTAKVLAWDCTSVTCNAWIRITSHEDTIQEQKQCPICGEAMEQREKEVTVKQK